VPSVASRRRSGTTAETGLALTGGLVRVSRGAPCEVCGRPDWCSRTEDGRLALCARVAEGSIRTARNGAHVHLLRRDRGYVPAPPPRRIEPLPPDLRPLLEGACAATPDDWFARLARRLGLPQESGIEALRRLGTHRARYVADEVLLMAPRSDEDAGRLHRWCQWIASKDLAAWPMWSRGRVVGVRTRDTATRKKMALPGGREALFVPADLPVGGELVAVAEGPTDSSALLAIGIEVVGRPSCCGAIEETLRLVLTLRPRRVAVMLDRDAPGIGGGVTLARELARIVDDVRCVLPPAPHKDGRQWVASGADRAAVLEAIERAPCVKGGAR